MADNKKKQGKQDDSRVDPHDTGEVGYMAKKLKTSAWKIYEAINEVGTSRKKIEIYIKDFHSNR
jgi:hypothetical protein